MVRERSGVATEWLILATAAIAGIALRVFVYRSLLGAEDSDEAILGLMVRHAAHGHLSAFLWGQVYGGSEEVLLTVPVFWIFGSSLLALRTIPILLDVVTAFLVWRVGLRTVGARQARAGATLCWIWPAWGVYEHVHQWGFYASGTFYCALLLLLALRVKERPDAVRVGLFGLAGGLGFYQTPQIVPVLIPMVAWIIWRAPRALRHAWLAVILAAVGASPWLAWNALHGWRSLHIKSGADFTYTHRLRVFLSPVLQEDLGLRFVDSESWIVPAAVGIAVLAALVALFAYGALASRRRDAALLYLVPAAFPLVYAIAPNATVSSDPRYAMVLAPCLVLILAQLASTPWRTALLLAAAFALSVVILRAADQSRIARARLPSTLATPRSLAGVVAGLDRLHLRRVFTNYWLAYRLDFDTNERLIAVENGFDGLAVDHGDVVPLVDPYVRWKPYQRAVRSGPHGFVFFPGSEPRPAILATLQAHGYTRHLVDGFVVYAPTVRP
jgi:4-amino-4-deoxy-L-arabinose transferase-like glycosyltransferase